MCLVYDLNLLRNRFSHVLYWEELVGKGLNSYLRIISKLITLNDLSSK